MAKIELGGHLWICEDERGDRHLYLNTQRLVDVLPHCDMEVKDDVGYALGDLCLLVNYGPVGITIDQSEVVAKRAIKRHRGASDILEECDSQTKSCPFCEGRTFYIELNEEDSMWAVFCRVCGNLGPVAVDRDGAIKRWNRRVKQEEL